MARSLEQSAVDRFLCSGRAALRNRSADAQDVGGRRASDGAAVGCEGSARGQAGSLDARARAERCTIETIVARAGVGLPAVGAEVEPRALAAGARASVEAAAARARAEVRAFTAANTPRACARFARGFDARARAVHPRRIEALRDPALANGAASWRRFAPEDASLDLRAALCAREAAIVVERDTAHALATRSGASDRGRRSQAASSRTRSRCRRICRRKR